MVYERICDFIKEMMEDEDMEIRWDSYLYSDLDIDSLSCVELGCELESEFNIKIPEEVYLEEPEKMTVGEFTTYIEGLIKSQNN